MKAENSILQLNNLSIGYNAPILSGINAEIKKGEIVLLIGKNGSGKTTLLKTIFKELAPLQGSVRIKNSNIYDIPSSEIGKLISVVLSRNMISPYLKMFDLIALGRYPYKKWYQKLTDKEIKDINQTIDLLDLRKYQNYYISELSDGNLQKTLIARALVQDCPLLILDEPTSYLDISNKLEIMEIISFLAKEKEKTILFTSHDLSLGLTLADKLWFIKEDEFKTGFTEDVADKENILDFFAGKQMEFNYNSNEYEFLKKSASINIKIIGESKSLYWLKKALIRNHFLLFEDAQISVYEKNSSFIIYYQNKEYSFSTIENIIDFLVSSARG